jgi:hypothetical protein
MWGLRVSESRVEMLGGILVHTKISVPANGSKGIKYVQNGRYQEKKKL